MAHRVAIYIYPYNHRMWIEGDTIVDDIACKNLYKHTKQLWDGGKEVLEVNQGAWKLENERGVTMDGNASLYQHKAEQYEADAPHHSDKSLPPAKGSQARLLGQGEALLNFYAAKLLLYFSASRLVANNCK